MRIVEFFEGEIFTNFEVCGYLRKCSPQSLGVYVFWWHQWAICESLYIMQKSFFHIFAKVSCSIRYLFLSPTFIYPFVRQSTVFWKLLVDVYFLFCANQSFYITMDDFESHDCTLAKTTQWTSLQTTYSMNINPPVQHVVLVGVKYNLDKNYDRN